MRGFHLERFSENDDPPPTQSASTAAHRREVSSSTGGTMRRHLSATLLAIALVVQPAAAQETVDLAMVARIKQEGLQRSRARELFMTLTDRIGARLTGSPAHKQAANWAKDRLAEFGLTDSRLEPFTFVHGWSLEKISVEMTEPRYMPLIAYAEAWTPGLSRVVTGRVIYVGNKTPAEVETMSEQLRGAIVLRDLPQTHFLDADRPQPGISKDRRRGLHRGQCRMED